jgi:hypothetical protein
MKLSKFLLLITVAIITAFVSTPAKSQAISLVSQYSSTVDTVTNSATKYLTAPAPISGYKKLITIQFWAVEISGTTAGTAQVQASLDGSIWYNIGSAYTLTDVASQTNGFTITDWGSLYLRVAITGSGTMSDKVYSKYLVRSFP